MLERIATIVGILTLVYLAIGVGFGIVGTIMIGEFELVPFVMVMLLWLPLLMMAWALE